MVPKKPSKNTQLNNKFITMDLECIQINNTLIPYLLCWYNGKKSYSYFLTSPYELESLQNSNSDDLESSISAMIQDAMVDICKRKYRGHRIYFHNFSKFDGYFLIRHLSRLGVCDPIIHKDRIISCSFTLYETGVRVIFKDSYLMLPSSLKKTW